MGEPPARRCQFVWASRMQAHRSSKSPIITSIETRVGGTSDVSAIKLDPHTFRWAASYLRTEIKKRKKINAFRRTTWESSFFSFRIPKYCHEQKLLKKPDGSQVSISYIIINKRNPLAAILAGIIKGCAGSPSDLRAHKTLGSKYHILAQAHCSGSIAQIHRIPLRKNTPVDLSY